MRVFVPGTPAPQGSKRHVGRGVMVESSKRVGPWRERVALVVSNAWTDELGEPMPPILAGVPVVLKIRFLFRRPRGHFGTGRNADVLKTGAPRLPATRPDVDKLVRAVLDGMTGVVLADDAQVAALHAGKEYTAGPEGASIEWAPIR